jgi:hypothetical protein
MIPVQVMVGEMEMVTVAAAVVMEVKTTATAMGAMPDPVAVTNTITNWKKSDRSASI